MSGPTGSRVSVAGMSESSSSQGSATDREAGADTADSRQVSRKPRKQRSKSSRSSVVPVSADLGVTHVCDFTECKLPAEDWYLASKTRRT